MSQGDASKDVLPASVERELALNRAQVKTADVLHEFRDKVQYGDVNADGEFVPNPDGRKYQIDISDTASREKFKEMRKGYRRVAAEVQHDKSADLNPVKMRDPNGKVRHISEAIVEMEAQNKGFREASAFPATRVLRHRLDESKFCSECGLRWAWCECE